MPIEKTISSAILTAIRSRRHSHSPANEEGEKHAGTAVASVKLREAKFSDFKAVEELKQRGRLATDSFENWERLWRNNPAVTNAKTVYPIGWVLEAGTSIVGYLGNIVLQYRFGNRALTAATSHGLVVDPGYRFGAMSLVSAYFRQRSVDLFLTTTAIESVGKISRSFKSITLPQPEYESVLFWVLKPRSFAQAVVRKMALNSILARTGEIVISALVAGDKFLRRRWPQPPSPCISVEEIELDQIGDEFETLWNESYSERTQLLADRSPRVLRWHFEMPGDKGSVSVLCCRRNGELGGYAVLRHEPPTRESGLRRSILADSLARNDDPQILAALWAAAYQQAKQAGSHIFEVLGFPPNIRRVCSRWRPYVRRYPACPFYYKAADPALHETLSDGAAWYATPFDGDTTLWNFGVSS